tara:strand:+ start:3309 stop:3776 length:468 start_codon:yes stop_codon:yes gene_type:complete
MTNAAGSAGIDIPVFIRNAISMAILRGGESRFAEITLSPKNGSSVDQMMEWVYARSPIVSDFVCTGGELQPEVKTALYATLPETQARRFEKVLNGLKLEMIGHDEGCSRQAVHASIKRAITTLRSNHEFAKALCDSMPDVGITPDILLQAVNHER